jgi:UDPglucose--hexose-1-phosphate uridylyltransferase
MSELRWDPLKLHWVIIATERGRRPRDFLVEPVNGEMTSCPFCYGNEDRTPGEIFAIRPSGPANTPNWQGPGDSQQVPGVAHRRDTE